MPRPFKEKRELAGQKKSTEEQTAFIRDRLESILEIVTKLACGTSARQKEILAKAPKSVQDETRQPISQAILTLKEDPQRTLDQRMAAVLRAPLIDLALKQISLLNRIMTCLQTTTLYSDNVVSPWVRYSNTVQPPMNTFYVHGSWVERQLSNYRAVEELHKYLKQEQDRLDAIYCEATMERIKQESWFNTISAAHKSHWNIARLALETCVTKSGGFGGSLDEQGVLQVIWIGWLPELRELIIACSEVEVRLQKLLSDMFLMNHNITGGPK